MEWMERAADDLKLLETRRQAAEGLRAQIAVIEADILSLSGVNSSRVPIKGGGNRQEQRLCSFIDRKDKLVAKEKAQRELVRHTERVLHSLGERERAVLEGFYCTQLRRGDAVRKLVRDLHIGQSEVYRTRERALQEFARKMGYL